RGHDVEPRFNDDIHEVSLPEGRGFGLDSERLACAPSTVNLARMAEEINPINDATTTTTIKCVVPWIAIHTVSPHDRTITNTSRAIARSSSAGPAIIRESAPKAPSAHSTKEIQPANTIIFTGPPPVVRWSLAVQNVAVRHHHRLALQVSPAHNPVLTQSRESFGPQYLGSRPGKLGQLIHQECR